MSRLPGAWLTDVAVEACPICLAGEACGNAGNPDSKARGGPPIENSLDQDGLRKARPGAAVPLATLGEAEEDARK